MKKIGFILPTKEWMGGLNYYKNLLYALSLLDDKNLNLVVFIGVKTDVDIKQIFSQYAQLVEHPMFDLNSFYWYTNKILYQLFDSNYFLNNFLKKNSVDILSHYDMAGFKHCKSISWIPDFQHYYLPEMFSKRNLNTRNNKYQKLIKKSDVVICSSNSALNDLKHFSPDHLCKTAVLQFVSQPPKDFFSVSKNDELYIKKKYNINHAFFYLPNQLWAHKNHLVAFKAIDYLKKNGIEVTLVCSGAIDDYRDKNHVTNLIDYIVNNGLSNNILILGLIPYSDVFSLIKYSKAVINPSLFEGWSSTVEECKSVGKTMILSDLDVHKEQYPDACFFEKDNEIDLANKIESINKMILSQNNIKNDHVKSTLKDRTIKFAETYRNILELLE